MLKAIIDHCIQRRLATIAVTLGIAVYGFSAYLQTPIEAFPDVTNIEVNIIAQMDGYAAEEVQRQVTVPLERVFNGTPGMIMMRSESLFGLSLIKLIFDDDVEGARARNLVFQRMALAELPEGVVPELAPDATPLGRIYQFKLHSDRHTLTELRSEAEWNVSRMLLQVPGVAEVSARGGYLKELHVVVDPDRLLAYNLELEDINDALEASNLNVGGGYLKHGDQALAIRGIGYMGGAGDIKSVVLRADDGVPVTVGDVARVYASHTPRQGTIGIDEDNDVVVGMVMLRRGENPSVVLGDIQKMVERINADYLPEGMKIVPFYDRSELVGLTLSTVHNNLFHGFLLIVGVVWLFFRSIRGSFIVATIIPLSLLSAFIGLHYLGLPANLISMGAIDFGILVDGAVVLVENVLHQARHHKPATRREMLQLVSKAALAVARPTFFAMAIIIAALLPIFTLERVEGRIFAPLAMTYSFALLGALIFALTLVPALCALLINTNYTEKLREPAFVEKLREYYRLALDKVMARSMYVFGVAAFVFLLGVFIASRLGTEFLPELDEGDIVVFAEMSPSISLEKGQELLGDQRRRLLQFPEVELTMTLQGRPEDGTDNEGLNLGQTFVKLKPHDQWRRGLSKDQLIEEMRESLTEIPGVRFNFSQPIRDSVEESISGVRGQVVLKIFGEDLHRMRATLEEAREALTGIEGIVDLDLYRDATVPQVRINLDRQALAREGIRIQDAQTVVRTALAGYVVTDIWEGEIPVPVRVRLPASEKQNLDRIGEIGLTGADGVIVPLREVAEIDIEVGLAGITRESNQAYLALKFNIHGRDMGSVVNESIAAVQEHVELPPGHTFAWGGEFENQERAMQRLQVIVPVALLIILALLYGALQSGRSAWTIIMSMPFGIVGGLFALWIAGLPLSVSATIGFIALLGQVSLMGLLILTAVDDYRREGVELMTALYQGCADRFRSVLMASLLAALGLLPMAVSTGVGSETQKPFAVVIVGGMITTLIVALFLLPVLYRYTAGSKVPALQQDELS